MTALDIEICVAQYFNPRVNIVVPNVSWGLGLHECDLLIMTKAGYLWEVEIKTSRSDLIADKKKKHGHSSNKIKYLWFAVPEGLVEAGLQHIPDRAGLLEIVEYEGGLYCRKRRPALQNPYAEKQDIRTRDKLLHLAAMRIWTMKKQMQRRNHDL